MTLQVTTAATGVARTAHYVIPTGQTQAIPTLLLEPQRTNLCIRSEEFNLWTTQFGGAVTANAITSPDGTLTADLITGGGVNESGVFQGITFSGDGEKSFGIFLKAGTSPSTDLLVFDTTASAVRHRIRVTWTAGVPTIASNAGAGTLYPIESLGNGWYRILFTATGVVAANSNRLYIYPHNLTPYTGTIYAWGAQAENAIVPSSYIKTEGLVVSRNADSLYFPFTAAPQAMTVYVRGVERGTRLEPGAYIWQVSQTNNNPRVHVNRTVGTAQMQFQTVNTAGTFTTILRPSGTDTNVGDLVEYRSILSANGTVGFAVTLNNGTEAVSTPIAGTALEAAWSGQRLWIGTNGAGAVGLFGFTHVAIAQGEQSRDTMRQLAGVV